MSDGENVVKRHRANVECAFELLEQLLFLPDGMQIVGVRPSDCPYTAVIIVEDARLPLATDDAPRTIKPIFKQSANGTRCDGWKTDRGEYVPAHLHGEELRTFMRDRAYPRESEYA